MRGQQQAMRRTAGGQQLLRLRHLGVRLRAGDHHDQQRRTQRHGAGLVQQCRRRLRVAHALGAGKQLAERLAGLAFHGEKAPGP
ncbi:hypothetical protein D3C81_1158920 [compost metagenome]